MMKVALVNLPWRDGNRLGVRAGSRWPFTSETVPGGRLLYVPFPFFLAYAAALLKKNGFETVLIDSIAAGEDYADVCFRLARSGPGLLAAEISTPSLTGDLRMLEQLRGDFPGMKIAVCGAHATVKHRELLENNPFIDFVLRGEYEYILLELSRALVSGAGLENIRGLAYRAAGASPKDNGIYRLYDLDSLPWPERDALPLSSYNDGFCGLPSPNAQMLSGRGCPLGCIFCLWPQTIYGGGTYRSRSARDVADEFEYLAKDKGFKAVYFDDDIFNLRREHALDICSELKKRKLNVPWAAMARADLMDEELISSMAGAGAYALKYGIESADRRVNELCGKRADLDKSLKMILSTRRCGIKTHLTFCLGLPGENKDTLSRNRDFVVRAAPDSLQVSFAVPFPGTAYYDQARREGSLLSDNWDDYDGNRMCVIKNGDFSPEDLEKTKNDLLRSCNL